MIYLHIDADILDAALVPNHPTKETRGPNLSEVAGAIDIVMATGKVVALALVSVSFDAESPVDVASGVALLRHALSSWRTHGEWHSI